MGLLHDFLHDGSTVQAARIDNEIAACTIPFGAMRVQFSKALLRFRLPGNR